MADLADGRPGDVFVHDLVLGPFPTTLVPPEYERYEEDKENDGSYDPSDYCGVVDRGARGRGTAQVVLRCSGGTEATVSRGCVVVG